MDQDGEGGLPWWLLGSEVADRLRAGALVAHLFCGRGAALVGLALAFPRSTFVGFDLCSDSVSAGRQHAAESGVEERASFEPASPEDFPGRGYDFVFSPGASPECIGPGARHILGALRPDGRWLIVAGPADETHLRESVAAAGFGGFRLASAGRDVWIWEASR